MVQTVGGAAIILFYNILHIALVVRRGNGVNKMRGVKRWIMLKSF